VIELTINRLTNALDDIVLTVETIMKIKEPSFNPFREIIHEIIFDIVKSIPKIV
jgi:hypothetical protein